MRRPLTVLLALLVAFSLVGPATATEPPTPTVEPTPTVDPAPTVDPTLTPTPDPAPTATPDPTPAATVEPAPTVDPTPAAPTDLAANDPSDERGIPSTAGRYIVVLRDGADTAAVVERHRSREGTRATRAFDRAMRGFAARLDARQRKALEADPNVLAIVPD
ncbi:hypothetical protein BH20CHL7_BH20CHL7_03910 [soil metagenome]